jgi:hypothetical protein
MKPQRTESTSDILDLEEGNLVPQPQPAALAPPSSSTVAAIAPPATNNNPRPCGDQKQLQQQYQLHNCNPKLQQQQQQHANFINAMSIETDV